MAKGSHAASPGLKGEPAPPCAHFLAWKPFAINAAPIDYLDALLALAPDLEHFTAAEAQQVLKGRFATEAVFGPVG